MERQRLKKTKETVETVETSRDTCKYKIVWRDRERRFSGFLGDRSAVTFSPTYFVSVFGDRRLARYPRHGRAGSISREPFKCDARTVR